MSDTNWLNQDKSRTSFDKALKLYIKGRLWSLFLQGGVAYGGFHKWGTPIAGWFIMEHPFNMDDVEGTIILGNLHIKLPKTCHSGPLAVLKSGEQLADSMCQLVASRENPLFLRPNDLLFSPCVREGTVSDTSSHNACWMMAGMQQWQTWSPQRYTNSSRVCWSSAL
jgi:hypothetical protein